MRTGRARRRLLLGGMAVVLAATGCGSPAPSASATPSSLATTPAPVPTTPVPPNLAGQLFYVPFDHAGPAPVALVSWAPAGATTKDRLRLPWIDLIENLMVSPDGRRVAWVESSNQTLYVADADGSNKKGLGKGVDTCEPTWSPDGSQIYGYGFDGGDKPALVNVATGTTTALPGSPGCHVVFSADGSAIAYDDGGGDVFVARTTATAKVPRLGSDGGSTRRRSFCALSLSPDARQVALNVHSGNVPDGDIGRDLYANEIVDVTSGATLTLPGLPGTLISAFFLPGGGLVARTQSGANHAIAQYTADLALVRTVPEPASLAQYSLIGYGAAAT